MNTRVQPPNLQHQCSTKQLITRYETMGGVSETPRTARSAHPTDHIVNQPLAIQRQAQPTTKRKDKSPIRESFRSLLSVFKKGNGASKGKAGAKQGPFARDQPGDASPMVSKALVGRPSAPLDTTSPSTVGPRLSGPLLYFSRSAHFSSGSLIPPAWTACTATLEGNEITLLGSAMRENPTTHAISLSRCADVRSLSLGQLNDNERSVLLQEGDTREIRIFEILFEGRAREKFAVTSSRERAGWISAIWDAVLPSHEPRYISRQETDHCLMNSGPKGLGMANTDTLLPPIPSVGRPTPKPYHSSSILSNSFAERCLPPTPAELSRNPPLPFICRSSTTHSPVSPSIYPQTPSCASLSVQSRINSPSNEKTDRIETHLQKSIDPISPDDAIDIRQELQAMRSHLVNDLPGVLQKLDRIQETWGGSNRPGDTISSIPVKSDELLGRQGVGREDSWTFSTQSSATPEGKNPELSELMALVKDDHDQRNIQAQQQADSVRYLNELNTWLEAFVNNGTSQIQALAGGVNQLCRDLGGGTQSFDVPGGISGNPSNLRTEIRQLLLDVKKREEKSITLQNSVDALVALLNADTRKTSADTESMVSLVDRQYRAQEGLVRALATELSNEIKGERLRFVDAMKEATAINVQIHVEQFKQELTKEVLGMTEEVGRLHRERQAVENQIADLFAFYSKQKQTGTPFTAASMAQVVSQTAFEHYRPPSAAQHRPLPGRP